MIHAFPVMFLFITQQREEMAQLIFVYTYTLTEAKHAELVCGKQTAISWLLKDSAVSLCQQAFPSPPFT